MSASLLVRDLYQHLLSPVATGADRLSIATGYATPAMLFQVIADVINKFSGPVRIELLVGMVGRDGITRQDHEGFLALSREADFVDVRYTPAGRSAHTKLYVWSKDGLPVTAFAGSANFTRFGFLIASNADAHRELLTLVDPVEAYNEYQRLAEGTVPSDSANIRDEIRFVRIRPYELDPTMGLNRDPAVPDDGVVYRPDLDRLPQIILPLVALRNNPSTGTIRGEPHKQWGLNWGLRRSGKDEATIQVPAKAWRSNPDFFPKGHPGSRPQFHVTTDDGESLFLCTAADNAKELHSRPRNALLGEYFRGRLGVPYGTEVTIEHLRNGGGRFVKMYRTGVDSYHMEYAKSVEDEGAILYRM